MRKRSVLGWATRALGVAVLAGGQLVFGAAGSSAATFNVTNGNDSGPGSLRQAFIDATNGAGDDIIAVDDAVNTITLTSGAVGHGDPGNAALMIQGNGVTIHQSTANARVIMNGSTGLLTLDSVTLTGGNVGDGSSGGGVVSSGPVTLANSTVTNNQNTATTGGGIGSLDDVVLTNSVVSMNSAVGNGGGVVSNGDVMLTNSSVTGNTGGGSTTLGGSGGISALGSLIVTNSTIANNNGTASGGISVGGAGAQAGPVAVTDSTVSGNTASSGDSVAAGGIGSGGAVSVDTSTISGNSATSSTTDAAGGVGTLGGDVTVENSTVTNNAGTAAGIGVGGIGGNDVSLKHVTVTNNTGADTGNVSALDVFGDNGSLTTFASVMADPGSPNCTIGADGTISNGYNFADDTSCALVHGTDSQNAGSDPMLGALANNGGPTQTRLPAFASPLVDAIPNASCDGTATNDQRGEPRPATAGSSCDIGAVEGSSPPPPPPPPGSPVCPAAASSQGGGSLEGAEVLAGVAPAGLHAWWRRRRGSTIAVKNARRPRSLLAAFVLVGVAVVIVSACAGVKPPTPPGC